MSAEKALLRMEEVAEILQISRARAYSMVAAGEIPSVALGRRSKRVPVRQLQEWIDKQVLPAGPDPAGGRSADSCAAVDLDRADDDEAELGLR